MPRVSDYLKIIVLPQVKNNGLIGPFFNESESFSILIVIFFVNKAKQGETNA